MASGFITFEKPQKKTANLWVEKYRPKTLDDYIGNDHIKDKVQTYIDSNDPPHLLFSGVAGTGKTTLAKIITNNIDCEMMYINASDENSVDTIRTRVKQFASSIAIAEIKVVILDEFDYMSQSAQAALRNIMETFVEHTRFILTCNYIDKVINPIVSRTQHYIIKPPSMKEVAANMAMILDKEDVEFEPQQVGIIVKKYYPDVRKIINFAQQSTVAQDDGFVLDVDTDSLVENDIRFKIVDRFKEGGTAKKMFNDIRKLVSEAAVNDYSDLYKFLFDHIDDYVPKGKVPHVMIQLSEAQYRDSMVVDHEINFMHFAIETIKVLNK